ncbi:MAG: hypothetical protein ACI83D_000755 [Planctomycetota bacterium]|jgi:hypothetical protein
MKKIVYLSLFSTCVVFLAPNGNTNKDLSVQKLAQKLERFNDNQAQLLDTTPNQLGTLD